MKLHICFFRTRTIDGTCRMIEMTHKFCRLFLAVTILFAFGGVSELCACMCGKAATCERFNFSDVIFVGKAIRVEREENGPFKTETTVFEIKEMFAGEKSETIRVRNRSGFSCDTSFDLDETYLVFASGSKTDGFGTGFCSGNLPLEYAAGEIAELRGLSSAKGDGKLRGTVFEEFKERGKDENRTPLKDVRLDVSEINTRRRYTARSDEKGRYEIVVPPGKYKVSPVIPKVQS